MNIQLSLLPDNKNINTAISSKVIKLDNLFLKYFLKRSKRRTIGFSIDNKELTISAPEKLSINKIENHIYEKKKWIINTINYQKKYYQQKQKVSFKFDAFNTIPFIGEKFTLKIASCNKEMVLLNLKLNEILIYCYSHRNEKYIKEYFLKFIKNKANFFFRKEFHFMPEF